MQEQLRPIWLCADDYGISRSVNKAIRDLGAAQRINATSVMVGAPGFDAEEVAALKQVNSGTPKLAIGLHVTLTAPFRPLTETFSPLRHGAFLPMREALRAAVLRRLRRDALVAEITAQAKAFVAAFGRPPDFFDGHQHVQLFPQIRDAFLRVAHEIAPNAWVRQCGRSLPRAKRIRDRKGLLLDILSVRFRRRARRIGMTVNPAFAGTYDFTPDADFARLFPAFLQGLPAGGVVMCHPGFVDAELVRLDTLTALREREYAYLAGDEFPAVMALNEVTLATPPGG